MKHRTRWFLLSLLLCLLVACSGGALDSPEGAVEPGVGEGEEPVGESGAEDVSGTEEEAGAEDAAAEEASGDELTVADVQEKGTLVVGTAITKPFEYHDPETNELVGFDVDVANYIGEQLGVEVEFVEMPFASLIPSLQTRKVDMVIAAMYIKPEREEVIDFAEPYMETGLVMVVPPELAGEVSAVEDLEGRSVGVKSGATGDALAQELLDQGINLERREYKETLESFTDLEAGRIEVVLNDYLNTLAYLNDTGSDLMIVSNENGEPNFLSNVGLGIAVHSGDAELLAHINDSLTQLHDDGTYDQLYEKWLGVARGESE